MTGPTPRPPRPQAEELRSRVVVLRRALAQVGRADERVPTRVPATRRIAAAFGLLILMLTGSAGYVVERGDTLSGIANRLGTDVSTLAAHNGIDDPNRIFVGQQLRVPGAAAATTPTVPAAPAPSAEATYTVRRGDALSRIARRLGVTTAALAKANGLRDVNRIFVGQVLTVPGAATPAPAAPPSPAATPAPQPATPSAAPVVPATTSYTVARGDSLSRIASRHGVTLQAIVDANGITDPNRIFVGQVLTVPGGSPAPEVAPTPAPSTPSDAPISKAEVEALIEEVARSYGWNPAWVKALAWQESGWQQTVVSHVGATGIMQVMPETGRFISRSLVGRPLDLTDPRDNVVAGVAFIDYLFDLTGGDIDMTLAGYYQGLGSVRRNGMYSDTERYIRNIRALKERFER